MDTKQFQSLLEEKGISLSPRQLEQFQIYYELLIEWNEKMNLTAITDQSGVYLKHFFDSISPAFYYDFSKPMSLCDVGAGAGFPSIPLKICFPHLKLSIVDSLQKRITFLHALASALELEDVAFYHDRAETFARREGIREAFDVVMARAVARMSVLSELCLPLVKVNGTFIAMKAAAAQEELEQGKTAIKVLGGEVAATHSFTLPIEESERTIIFIHKKRKTTKQYPRKPGIPNKLPIE
ncbi:16S rRNA (guanine(527)-N(7))-methyltransferase RsmG [Anoxybacillus rupiensis]|jgi:16S rRNA (guanine527-N7)-methyltransferase|uniref:Ribosomal RNA small subunit methyltransferase G n=1 Tax=Anoxybacteroides rupiense TaxID=311460 RepID=A0ABD5IPQ0_9BACL|nr:MULTISPECIES: 16S rRNA (guanine(527)-N(7))-methyltransferase RsmG [Anoxybacillus]KXG08630.1 Ribosomal RNA small subunit methyltransferase G [Anoxybacillus sp. P3H1B]MBB3908187.1 16S rRNA (guanine527-N7)-methyltransferase [Anoxybacillus rupiensis]MBS2772314.1 16S rRNA (guanine(527)-N(7))-methyltransferase RsmG [Anoxybacillus rupiensis]MDE8563996.1 16S rRNA (guanine(527)-N(7))-methyltransferase RsmG [Anoxybacillus rupiensis]MED5050262.1 16S rRNA (guanine(527)-N(7))-methyltransferase RsmG [Ano